MHKLPLNFVCKQFKRFWGGTAYKHIHSTRVRERAKTSNIYRMDLNGIYDNHNQISIENFIYVRN